MILNWKVTQADHDLIVEIAQRACRMAARHNQHYGSQDAIMDLTAAHANGCPLDLEGLLDALASDFAHDVFGIRRHLNRDTGKLTEGGIFNPRYRATTK